MPAWLLTQSRTRPLYRWALILPALLVPGLGQAALDPETHVTLLAPGQTEPGTESLSGARTATVWMALSLDSQGLRLSPVEQHRASDWVSSTTTNSPQRQSPFYTPEGRTPELPENALLALGIDYAPDAAVRLQPGLFASRLPEPAAISSGWRRRLTPENSGLTLEARYDKQTDGRLLAGSMTLWLLQAHGDAQRLLPPAAGMAFQKQELLWVGDLDGDNLQDLLLKRVTLTGEVQYLLRLGTHTAIASLDPDHPYRIFSSGVDDYSTTTRHVRESRLLPEGPFGRAAFSSDDAPYNTKLAALTKLPAILEDRLLQMDADTFRFTLEYIPRVDSRDESTGGEEFWGGPVAVKVRFRNTTTTLMEMGELDGGFRMQIDRVEGVPAIRFDYAPHYNNEFSRYWLWDEQARRFKRWLINQSQGC